MPNWCTNDLTINAPTQDRLKEVLEAIRSDDEPLSLEVICPTPTSFQGRVSVVETEGKTFQEKLDASMKRLDDIGSGKAKDYEDWWEFHVGEWGTKWEINGVSIEETSPTEVWLSFTSAWSPPDKIIDKLMEKYPDVKFLLRFYEPGCEFAGEYGNDTDVCYEGKDDEYKPFAIKYFGEEFEDEKEE